MGGKSRRAIAIKNLANYREAKKAQQLATKSNSEMGKYSKKVRTSIQNLANYRAKKNQLLKQKQQQMKDGNCEDEVKVEPMDLDPSEDPGSEHEGLFLNLEEDSHVDGGIGDMRIDNGNKGWADASETDSSAVKLQPVTAGFSGTRTPKPPLPLIPRPADPSPSFCFVCTTVENIMPREEITRVDYFNLMTEMLELPAKLVYRYLDQLKKPEKWIGLCYHCLDVVREAVELKRKISKFTNDLKLSKREIVQRMKRTKLESKHSIAIGKNKKGKRIIIQNILAFVNNRKYVSVSRIDTNIREVQGPVVSKNQKFLSASFKKARETIRPKYARLDEDMDQKLLDDHFHHDDCDNEQLHHQIDSVHEQSTSAVNSPTPAITRKVNKRRMKRTVSSSDSSCSSSSDTERDFEEETIPAMKPEPTKNARAPKIHGSQTEVTEKAEKRYDCPQCPAFRNYGIIKFCQHLAIHQRRPYRCTICSTFLPAFEEQVKQHWTEKHSVELSSALSQNKPKYLTVDVDAGKMWKCDGCSLGFSEEDARNKHEMKCSKVDIGTTVPKSKKNVYSCQICKISDSLEHAFRNMEEWRLHRVLNHPEMDKKCCFFCDRSFLEKTLEGMDARNDKQMLNHIKEHHINVDISASTTVGIYDECEPCGAVLAGETCTKRHFKDVHGLPAGSKPFICPMSCGLAFTCGLNMRKHMYNIHFSSIPLICDVCGYTCVRSINLREHRLQKHGIIPEGAKTKILHCPVEECEFKAVVPKTLEIHSQMVHGDCRKYVCKYCGKGFASSGKLKVHEDIHENKETKPYKCEICGSSFAVRNYLYIHKRLSHEGRAFPSTNSKRGPRPKKKPSSDQSEENCTAMESAVPVAPQQQGNPDHIEDSPADDPSSLIGGPCLVNWRSGGELQ